MAEDLIQYFRDNFGDDYVHNYNTFDGEDDMYYLNMNPFTESKTFDHSATPDASNSETFVPTLFGSPSPTEQGAAMDIPYLPCYSPDTVLVHAQASSLPDSLELYSSDSTLGPQVPQKQAEYSTLAAYIFPQSPLNQGDIHLGELTFLQKEVALDVQLQEKILVDSQALPSITSSSTEGQRPSSSFWRGKSPALLMQQLKGPSLCASSSSSEARSAIRSPPHQPYSQTTKPQSTTTLNLTSLFNHFRGDGGIKISTGGGSERCPGSSAVEAFSTLPKCALGFGDCRAIQPQNEYYIGAKHVSSASGPGQRIVRTSSYDPHITADKTQAMSVSHLRHKRKVLSGLEILEEMQPKAAATAGLQSSNNSWSCSTSPSNKDGKVAPIELISGVQKTNSMRMDRASGGRGVWKKVKGEPSDEGALTQTAIFANAMVEQKDQKELQEKFLTLLQVDSSTPEDHKAQILDETIGYLKELRRRLNANEADSTRERSMKMPEAAITRSIIPVDLIKNTETPSPPTSTRCQKYTGDGMSSNDPINLEDLKLDTAGVEISPLLTVEHSPQIEVRMMENQHVVVKLTATDRPGLFHDIMQVLRGFRVDIQHANIRTSNKGQRNDIFAAKMQLPLFFSHSTNTLAMALNQAIGASPATPSASPEPHTPQT